MRSIPTIIIFLFLLHDASSQYKLSFEQYSFMGAGQASLLAPVAHFQSKQKWYAEARYNYEDINTFSLYAGRTFSQERKFSWSLTPMVGGMAGKLKGGSFGLNSECNYKKIYFSSQAQYCMSAESRLENFFYNWSEICYQPKEWFYAGFAFQHTRLYSSNSVVDPGVLIAFSYKQWNFPFYGFNLSADKRYFVAGINWEWKHNANKHKQPEPPALSVVNDRLVP
jgi:hypothetical protein